MTTFVFPIIPGQLGLATAGQLREAGASESALRHLEASGRRALRGVYTSRPGPLSDAEGLMASALWAGPDAALTGVQALVLHGLDPGRTPALRRFLVPASRRARRRACGVLTVRTRRLPAVQTRRGIPVAPVERALVDAARYRELGDRNLKAATIAALQTGRTTADRVAAELEYARRSGSGGVLDGVLAFREGAWSLPEAVLADAVRRHAGLPAMISNPRLVDADGTVIGTPDGWFPDAGVVVQVHSRQYHQGTDADGNDRWTATLERDLAYQSRGLTVVPVTPQTLTDAGTFLTHLEAVVAQRRGQSPEGIRVVS